MKPDPELAERWRRADGPERAFHIGVLVTTSLIALAVLAFSTPTLVSLGTAARDWILTSAGDDPCPKTIGRYQAMPNGDVLDTCSGTVRTPDP